VFALHRGPATKGRCSANHKEMTAWLQGPDSSQPSLGNRSQHRPMAHSYGFNNRKRRRKRQLLQSVPIRLLGPSPCDGWAERRAIIPNPGAITRAQQYCLTPNLRRASPGALSARRKFHPPMRPTAHRPKKTDWPCRTRDSRIRPPGSPFSGVLAKPINQPLERGFEFPPRLVRFCGLPTDAQPEDCKATNPFVLNQITAR